MQAGRRFIDALKMFYHVANIVRCASPRLGDSPGLDDAFAADPEEQLQTGVT